MIQPKILFYHSFVDCLSFRLKNSLIFILLNLNQNPFGMRILKFFLTLLILSISISNNYGQSSLRKANKQYELFAFNLAIKSYLKVLDRQPRNVQAIGRIADCYRHLNRMDEAASYYAQLMDLRNIEPVNYLQYGHVLKALGKYEEAKRQYYKYAEKYPVAGNQYAESCNFAKSKMEAPGRSSVKNEFLNTSSSDFAPSIYKAGQVVYSSGRRDITKSNRGGPKSGGFINNQLFFSNRDDNGFLRKPELLKKQIGSSANEAPIAYSPDGKYVAVTKNNYVNGTRQIPSSGFELSLHIGEVSSKGDFSNLIPFPYNGSGYSTGFANFSPDGNALYFASDRPDGFGGFDIYVSFKVGNSWSAPENLGAIINTQGHELTPFFDGRNLFFASDWHFGFGGLDLFSSKQMSTGGWNQVQHLGAGFNSSRDDYGYVFDPNYGVGYFVSNRLGGKGSEDIYKFEGVTNTDGDILTEGSNIDGIPGGNILLNIYSSTDKTPLADVNIDLSNCGGSIENKTDSNGQFKFNLEEGSVCNATLRKTGYISRQIIVNTSLEYNKSYEIFLTEEGDFYTGQVIHSSTRTTIEDVSVRATNTATNQRIEAVTDRSGKYSLALKPGGNYIVRYSKVGFKDINRTVRTGGSNPSKFIETIYLPPSSTNINEPTYTENPNKDSRNPEVVEPNNGNSAVNKEPAFRNGYAVQIAALSSSNVYLGEIENKVGATGNVFVYREGGKSKIRVGIFETRDEAKMAQVKLRRDGYNGAFIVMQTTMGYADYIFGYNPEITISEPDNNTETSVTEGYSPPSSTSTVDKSSRYGVRLGAFRNPQSFERDRDKFVSIGIIDSYQSGPYTIILLTGYDSFDMAKRALRKVKTKGYNEAYIVEKIGEEYTKARR